MVRFSEFLKAKGRTADEALLREYLSIRGEWARLEFKEAKGTSSFGLRKAVTAFANRDGGDLFLGVNDGGSVVGTSQDPSAVSRILNQEGSPTRGDCLTNLIGAVKEPVPIPIENGLRVLWIDVAPHGKCRFRKLSAQFFPKLSAQC
jgi:hypothetical protein